jgi:hypothetical protein
VQYRFMNPLLGVAPFDTVNGRNIMPQKLSELVNGYDERFDVPMILLAGTEDTKAPLSKVESLAGSTTAPHSLQVMPGINHDFPEDPGKIRYVLPMYLNALGQLLTTGIAQKPKHINSMLQRGLPEVSERAARERRQTVVLSAARPLNGASRSMIKAAAHADMDLAALVSHQADPIDYAKTMKYFGASGVVAEVPGADWRPRWMTGFASIDHPAVADRQSNLYLKRLIGATISGDSFFGDDDIVLEAETLLRAMGALEHFDFAGFQPIFEDLAVLGHAKLLAGMAPEVTISGNSLAVADKAGAEFFNGRHYNEDHCAIERAVERGRVALLGTIKQMPYDPFANPRRAEAEVFGEVVSDGRYFSLGLGKSYLDLGVDFWKFYKGLYGREIDHVVAKLEKKPPFGKDHDRISRTILSLRVMKARLASEEYAPEAFFTYVRALHYDSTERWPEVVAKTPKDRSLAGLMAYHGLKNSIEVGRPNRRSAQGLIY